MRSPHQDASGTAALATRKPIPIRLTKMIPYFEKRLTGCSIEETAGHLQHLGNMARKFERYADHLEDARRLKKNLGRPGCFSTHVQAKRPSKRRRRPWPDR